MYNIVVLTIDRQKILRLIIILHSNKKKKGFEQV